MKFSDIKKFTGRGNYCISSSWREIERTILHYEDRSVDISGLELEPDFQRGHVWTREEQVAYVEYGLRGGLSGMDIFFNCAGWMADYHGPFVLVDGLQRITAVREFVGNRLAVFGGNRICDFDDKMNSLSPSFNLNINDLGSREEVLRWYLELNTGGVVHSKEELNRVEALLEKERSKR